MSTELESNPFDKAAKKRKKPAGGESPVTTAETIQTVTEELPTVPAQTPKTSAEPVVEPVVEPTAEPAAAATPVESPATPEPKEERKSIGLVETYKRQMGPEREPRNVRLQLVITPSLNDKLNALVSQRKIVSKNDLLNYLLERYFEEMQG